MTAPPDPVAIVQNQLFPPGPQAPDAINMYDGAIQSKNGFGSWKSWDMRGWLNRLTWDLLRFQPLSKGKGPYPDPSVPYGLRDSVTRIMYQTDENNRILRKLAAVGNVDLTGIVDL